LGIELSHKNILFRADSSSTIGLGHIKRCLVLAKRLQGQHKDLNIIFATLHLDGNINEEIVQSGFFLHSLENNSASQLNDLIENRKINLIIIDSYDIDYAFEKQIQLHNQNIKVVSFDDMGKQHCANIVLNHGIQAKKSLYKDLVPRDCKLFCGSRYTLLRDEFFKKYNPKIVKKSIAIILGGNDVFNLSSTIADLLLEIDTQYKITVITTGVNPNIKELQKNKNIELLVDIDNIASVLVSKSLVITASGGTLFEILALKKKFINIEVATNQKVVSKFFKKKGIKTTIQAKEVTKEVLKTKLEYIKKNNVYKKLALQFAKKRLAKQILKELQ
jgi:UDP-2,4-diacetamido-2,4,6-trideoxy-beta-L-altropyranose hydrolase